ncbi:F510_1955 family glycosylhydrolase [Sutcliffiella cohnii]|uniref:F510_1955 family glycosylhydrolase n=1 Tax=Sutcliffiella cohnii TaxID=33932 RepID=UPI002E1C3422|nr:sialidase [Sutcliffiella cohnii]
MNFKAILLSFTIILLVTGCVANNNIQGSDSFYVELSNDKVDHVHGIGYLGENSDIFVATHHGIKRYSNGVWYETVTNNHDYMGFQATEVGFYASGHPEKGSKLKNPLGLVKSEDLGASLDTLAFYGETDFHYLAAGYNSLTIYALNEHPNKELDTGLYYTTDEGDTWKKSKMNGFTARSIGNIATHPTKSNMVAISTSQGLYFSDNYGDTFTLITSLNPVTTVEFQEDILLYVLMDGQGISLYQRELASSRDQTLSLPTNITLQNPILFLTSNPQNRDEVVVVTLQNEFFQTSNFGDNWEDITPTINP